ncbi:hypothetical protein FA09DRAFT_55989 [Tilletiopsis washingtonensis]|uniref:Uncharacterized protein n=1 Tax=Tilletiopsis washingtonensis TaxID=58919 RepID=A0A316Z7B3_9BASI|nr:hypothetical protein FA09DRAFT_55989 [Tilletiopsis washingtonensis]PWN97461.1 hypothetical protein FA09DRAFT_55989 [Tilletiopsis washingtonensis]
MSPRSAPRCAPQQAALERAGRRTRCVPSRCGTSGAAPSCELRQKKALRAQERGSMKRGCAARGVRAESSAALHAVCIWSSVRMRADRAVRRGPFGGKRGQGRPTIRAAAERQAPEGRVR